MTSDPTLKARLIGAANRPKRRTLAGIGAAGAVALAALAISLTSAAAATEKTVSVPGNVDFTDTGVALSSGEAVTIEASGTITYAPGHTVSPVGAKFTAKNCGTDAYAKPFDQAGLNCWAMTFKIGAAGVTFPVGKKITFHSPVSGELFLGVNDNEYGDNSGSWTAKIITP